MNVDRLVILYTLCFCVLLANTDGLVTNFISFCRFQISLRVYYISFKATLINWAISADSKWGFIYLYRQSTNSLKDALKKNRKFGCFVLNLLTLYLPSPLIFGPLPSPWHWDTMMKKIVGPLTIQFSIIHCVRNEKFIWIFCQHLFFMSSVYVPKTIDFWFCLRTKRFFKFQ